MEQFDEQENADKPRCNWGNSDAQYRAYHDNEWGWPVDNDIRLFEKACLEGFQSGLSWLTILRKREGFRLAFAGFEFEKIAKFDKNDVERLLQNADIVRHRGKIEATINNASVAIKLVDEFGSLAKYFWSFEPNPSERPSDYSWETLKAMAQTENSKNLAKDLKSRGWKFFGPTTAYAFMQAMGLVNDHIETCFCREQIEEAREKFERP